MIREIKRDDVPVCVDIIRKSFKTVADEFGFSIENAPRFTAFATTEERLYWQMDNEPRQMFVYEQNGVICGYYSWKIYFYISEQDKLRLMEKGHGL